MKESMKSKQNMAIRETTDVIIECLINDQSISESLISDSYSAALNKQEIFGKKNFSLVVLIQNAILRIQRTRFLTSEQKQNYRDELNKTLKELQNPLGTSPVQIKDLLSDTDDIKKQISEDDLNVELICSSINKLQDKIKKVKILNFDDNEKIPLLKYLQNLGVFLGKVSLYGLVFNSIIIVCLFFVLLIMDPYGIYTFLSNKI